MTVDAPLALAIDRTRS